MKLTWRDGLSSVLVILGIVVVIAKLQSYSWWLIGSWKGALGVVAVLGLGILLTNIEELVRVFNSSTLTQIILWFVAATVVVASLLSTTTQTEFYVAAFLIGVAWAAQIMDHALASIHSHTSHPMSV
jgi:hypothetical protein